MFPEQVNRKQLRGVVADMMRKAILDGHYKPGEWLRQERIAQELGVSQMPVREALKELAAEGIIEHMPYRGARVVQFTPDDILDLYSHRAFLEGRAANIAAKYITPEELDELKELQDEIESLFAPEDVMLYRSKNREFHKMIFTTSRHEYLIRTLNQLWTVFPTMLVANFSATASNPIPERDNLDIKEHRQIIGALEKRNGDLAEKYLKEHILATAQLLISSLG